MQRIIQNILGSIQPTAEEARAEKRFADDLVRTFQMFSPEGSRVVLTGSMAKGTFLRDKRDIDIFVLFNRNTPREKLEGYVKGIMAKALPGIGYQLSYAEHPYVRFHIHGRRIDLVPAYDITDSSQRLSAVDRSVLHTKFVNSRLGRDRIKDVLLLKAFLKSNSLYGAEIKTKGFSGYLCELLVIRFGSFIGLLRAARKWKGKIFIDLKGYHKGKERIRAMQNALSDFIVIDPTDPERNVAAAVSPDSLKRFISISKSFLKKPSEGFFNKKPEPFDQRARRLAREKGAHVYILTMPRPEVVDDILWGQLYRMIGQLEDYLSDFGPKTTIADDSRHLIKIALSLKKDILPPTMLLEGPPLMMEKHVKEFSRSHKGARFFIRKKRMCAEIKRRIRDPGSAIESFLHSYSKNRSHLACGEELVIIEKIAGNRPGNPAKKTARRKKTRA